MSQKTFYHSKRKTKGFFAHHSCFRSSLLGLEEDSLVFATARTRLFDPRQLYETNVQVSHDKLQEKANAMANQM
jgi:hypothetical protein